VILIDFTGRCGRQAYVEELPEHSYNEPKPVKQRIKQREVKVLLTEISIYTV
jgi:hypothetical protein